MAGLAKVTMIGNIAQDIELRTTGGGKSVTDIRLAVNERKGDEANFFDVTLWDKTAELVQQYCCKGSSIFVEGRLGVDQWQDKDTGAKRSKVTITADRVQFLGGRNNTQQQQEPAPQPPRPTPALAPQPQLVPPPAAAVDDVPF